MPPSRKSADDPHPDHLAGDQYAFLIGQLKTATENASRGLEILSRESQTQSAALIKAVSTLEAVGKQVAELSLLVRDGDGSLLNQVRVSREDVTDLRDDHANLEERVESLEEFKDNAQRRWNWLLGGRAVVLWVFGSAAALIAFALSVYAALGQWYGGKGNSQ